MGSLSVPDIRSKVLKSDYNNDTTAIKNAILNGKDADGNDPESGMPRFAANLSDSEMNQIIIHLQYLQ